MVDCPHLLCLWHAQEVLSRNRVVERALHARLAALLKIGKRTDVFDHADCLRQNLQLTVGFSQLFLETYDPFFVLLAAEAKLEVLHVASPEVGDSRFLSSLGPEGRLLTDDLGRLQKPSAASKQSIVFLCDQLVPQALLRRLAVFAQHPDALVVRPAPSRRVLVQHPLLPSVRLQLDLPHPHDVRICVCHFADSKIFGQWT